MRRSPAGALLALLVFAIPVIAHGKAKSVPKAARAAAAKAVMDHEDQWSDEESINFWLDNYFENPDTYAFEVVEKSRSAAGKARGPASAEMRLKVTFPAATDEPEMEKLTGTCEVLASGAPGGWQARVVPESCLLD